MKQDSTSKGKSLTKKWRPWEAGSTFTQTLEKPPSAKGTLNWEASHWHFDSLFKKLKSCADYNCLLFRKVQIKCLFAQHEPAIPSEVNGKPEPPQQGWRPGKILIKLCSIEGGHQPQDTGSCAIRSPLPEVASSTDAEEDAWTCVRVRMCTAASPEQHPSKNLKTGTVQGLHSCG